MVRRRLGWDDSGSVMVCWLFWVVCVVLEGWGSGVVAIVLWFSVAMVLQGLKW